MAHARSSYRKFLNLSVVALTVGAISLIAVPAIAAPPAVAAPFTVPGTQVDPDKIVIPDSTAPHVYKFSVPVPDGGRLRALQYADDGKSVAGAIVVEDAAGVPVGAYDDVVAQDATGRPVPTTYQLEGTTLVQTVTFDRSTSFPVVIDPNYSEIGRPGAQPAIGLLAFVGVPSNYVYNPSLGSLHDYCTNSPDEFPNPLGDNANFRGPCARHDLCYGGGTTSKFTCDNRLYSDMVSNCDDAYGFLNPARVLCHTTAEIYWAAVVIAT